MTEAAQAATLPQSSSLDQPPNTRRGVLRSAEIDVRLLGMLIALGIVWIAFHLLSGGNFITPRNLWNLSVQSSSIGIMATGMVLVIVSRNIDLSVGSLLGFVAYSMAMMQVIWLPISAGLGLGNPLILPITVIFGLIIGGVIGLVQGFVIAYLGVPSFIVTLGGLLVWRGLIFQYIQGQTIAPLDPTFRLIGGGPTGSVGEVASWIFGLIACVGIIYTLIAGRRRKRRYGFTLRPVWADVAIGVAASVAVLAAVWTANSYYWPEALAAQFAAAHGIVAPPGGLNIPTGIANPVLLMLVVGLVMTYIATRRRFGRNVYAIGGNPEAAELSGINVRRTIMYVFGLMGVLVAISAVVTSARLNSAVTGLGVGNELDVISAAVIGGTSFAGGIGTIPGAILGAVVMQSLRSGMLLLRVDSPVQDIVVGIVLVAAVGLDSFVRRRSK
jgi:D-xylose transport system permease protein